MDQNCKLCSLIQNGKNLVAFFIDRTRIFTGFDWAAFKTCLLALGMLVGSYFSEKIKKLAPLLWVIFFATCLYTILRLLFGDESDRA